MPASNFGTVTIDLIRLHPGEGRACGCEPARRTEFRGRSRRGASRRGAFALLALLAGLSGGGFSQALAQSWQSPDWVPFYRPTAAQEIVLQKMRDSGSCLSKLSQLWSVGRVFALDHADRLPSDWGEFTNGLASAAILYCPADAAHPAQTNWNQVDFAAVSYELVSPGIRMSASEQTYIRCRIHQNALTSHGTAIEAHPYGLKGQSFPLVGMPTPSLLAARDAATSLDCLNHLKEILLSTLVFATDNGDILPQTLADLAETGMRPAVLRCPADLLQPAPTDFSDAAVASANYSLDSPGATTTDAALPVAHCRVHGHTATVGDPLSQGTNRYPPRLIVGHPLSRTVAPSHTTTLEVLTGDPALGPFRFQWRRPQPFDATGQPFTNTVEIAGATNAAYLIPKAGAEDEGYYDVVVWDSSGGCQLSHMAYVRVESLVRARVDPNLVCINNLQGISLAGRLYAARHQDALPTALAELPPYLGWPLMLHCPAATSGSVAFSWELVDFDRASYELGFGVLATCRVHGYSVLADGSMIADPPRLFLAPLAPGDSLRVTAIAWPNAECTLESSADLATWAPVVTNGLRGGMLHWTNSNSKAEAAQFYRVKVQ